MTFVHGMNGPELEKYGRHYFKCAVRKPKHHGNTGTCMDLLKSSIRFILLGCGEMILAYIVSAIRLELDDLVGQFMTGEDGMHLFCNNLYEKNRMFRLPCKLSLQ